MTVGPEHHRRRGPRRGVHPDPTERGSVTAFALLLAVALFALAGLVLDGGAAVNAHQAALSEAEQAARRGAGELSVSDLRAGRVVVDPVRASQAVTSFTDAAGHPGVAQVDGDTVTVTVEYRIPTTVLGMVRITSLPVSATASATDVAGVATAGAPGLTAGTGIGSGPGTVTP